MTSRGTRYWSSSAIPLVAPEMLGDLIAAASDLAIVVTPEGRVLSVLLGSASHGDANPIGPLDHWEGADLRRHLTPESVPKLDAALEAMAEGRAARPAELNHTDAAAPDLPVRYSFHSIGPGGAVLMMGRDLRPIAEMQQRLVRAQAALERDYEAGRALETRYRVLLASVREPIAFVSLATGRIADLNAPAARLLGAGVSDLTGVGLAGEIEGRRRSELLEALGTTDGDGASVTAQARRSGREITLRSVPFRSGGERLALVRIEARAPAAGGGGVEAALGRLFERGADAVAIVDAAGSIRQANEAFQTLIDAAGPAAVEGRPIADFLARGSADLKVLRDAAGAAGTVRLYATALTTAFGGRVPVEISATALGGGEDGPDGFALVFRDVARAEALRGSGSPADSGAGGFGRPVAELVGSAPLRDIVAQTTDAVERLCIATAVELTGNNRVAAAEMLGLSRQSLYVKLRKYDLLAKDAED